MRRTLILSSLLSLMLATAAAAAPKVEDLRRTLAGQNFKIVHFDFNRDTLDAEARRKLDRQAAFIRRHDDIVFGVVGHTDLVGNRAYNQQLGLRRANRVVRYLMSKGVKPHQLRAMISRGEDRPRVRTEDRERLNRRVETTVLMHVDDRRNRGQGGKASSGGTTVTASVVPRRPTAGTTTAVPVAPSSGSTPTTPAASTPTPSSPAPTSPTTSSPTPTSPTPTDPAPAPTKPRPGNSAFGTGKPDAGGGNGDEPSGDPAGSVGHNRGGDETPTGG